MTERLNPYIDHPSRLRAGCVAQILVLFFAAQFFAAALTSCSSPPHPDRVGSEQPVDGRGAESLRREQRPISDTHPYQINDYLIYPVKWHKVEDLAPTVQELFQARYGPGVVVIPHIPTNKLLIYLPPPQERERAGATGVRSGLRAPSRGGTTRGRTSR